MAQTFRTEDEILAVVSGFEDCTLSKEAFSHGNHITVAAYYLLNSNPAEALTKMRTGLLRFINHHGVDPAKYDEPLTRAWIELIQQVIDEQTDRSLVTITNNVLDRLAQHRIVLPK
jgi:hypothetical protein